MKVVGIIHLSLSLEVQCVERDFTLRTVKNFKEDKYVKSHLQVICTWKKELHQLLVEEITKIKNHMYAFII